jgi:uncharacterized Zn finger protein
MSYYGSPWRKYVPVAERHRKAQRKMDQLRKKGMKIQPVEIEGRTIAKTFWGKAWCDHMETLGDYENRLPRGRTYVRNGSVCHLDIQKGHITALVSGSSLYKIEVKISTLPKAKWNRIKQQCGGRIGSLIELLQGSLSAGVMEVVTDRKDGLFPSADEIRLACDCPDWAGLCKHLAAVLYAVGARLDQRPELLFLLRGVKHDELIDGRLDKVVADATGRGGRRRTVESDHLSDVFGIDLEETPVVENGAEKAGSGSRREKAPKKTTAKTKPSARQNKATSTGKKPAIKKATPAKKPTAGKATTKKKLASAKASLPISAKKRTAKTDAKKSVSSVQKPTPGKRGVRPQVGSIGHV